MEAKDIHPMNFCYGTDIETGVPVLVETKWRRWHHGIVLGQAGSGKTKFLQQEIKQVLNNTTDDVIVIDTSGAGEYNALCEQYGGKLVHVAGDLEHYGNPLLNAWETADPYCGPTEAMIRTENYVLSLCESALDKEKLSPAQKSLISRGMQYISKPLIEQWNPSDESSATLCPTLDDLQKYFVEILAPCTKETLEKYLYPEVKYEVSEIIEALDKVAENFRGIFLREKKCELCNRLVVHKADNNVSGHFKSIAALIALDDAWTQALRNRAKGVNTWIFIDDACYIFSNRAVFGYFYDIYRCAHMQGCSILCATQNTELFKQKYAFRNDLWPCSWLANTDFIVAMRQRAADFEQLVDDNFFDAEWASVNEKLRPNEGFLYRLHEREPITLFSMRD